MITFKPLKRLLVEKNMKITHLQRELGVAERFTTNVRDNKPINMTHIAKICEILKCQPADIIKYEED